MMSANSRIRFGLQIVFVCLYITPSHYHHCANFIWRHWTYEMPVRYNLSSVWVRLSIFSQVFIIQYVGLCVFSLPISYVMIERIYILCLIIIIKSEVWTITHCLGLGHETMVCAVCLSIFLFLLWGFALLCIVWIFGNQKRLYCLNHFLVVNNICAWMNSWANNRDAGDLRRHRAHHVCIQTAIHFFGYTKGLCVKLQGSTLDIVQAYTMINNVKSVLTSARSDDKECDIVYTKMEAMAELAHVELVVPR